jgi:hypothetical protein
MRTELLCVGAYLYGSPLWQAREKVCYTNFSAKPSHLLSVLPKSTAPALNLVEPIHCTEYREVKSPIGSISLVDRTSDPTANCSCHLN